MWQVQDVNAYSLIAVQHLSRFCRSRNCWLRILRIDVAFQVSQFFNGHCVDAHPCLSSARDADEKKKKLTHNIANWAESQKKPKWRQALWIVTQRPPERWTRRAAEWNPGLITSTRSPKKQEDQPRDGKKDDLNEFVKVEETDATQSNDLNQ